MASRSGYDGQTTGVTEPFTKEQRQRLEALTFARRLVGYMNDARTQPVDDWMRLAQYIETGNDTATR